MHGTRVRSGRPIARASARDAWKNRPMATFDLRDERFRDIALGCVFVGFSFNHSLLFELREIPHEYYWFVPCGQVFFSLPVSPCCCDNSCSFCFCGIKIIDIFVNDFKEGF